MDAVICYCNQVSKEVIEKAIKEGAKSLKDIQEITGACTGNHCKELNPSGQCCSAEINSMLSNKKSDVGIKCCCCS